MAATRSFARDIGTQLGFGFGNSATGVGGTGAVGTSPNSVFNTPGAQYPGNYLPGHTTFDLALGKTFAENYSVSIDALNVANRRVQLDNSLTFGGFHWNDPRQIYVEFRYRFHY